MNRREFLVTTACLPWLAARGAEPTAVSLTEILEAVVRDGVAPGAALAVSRDGKLVFEKALGTYCSLRDRQTPLTLETRHPLYSFSKLITGTVVAMAVGEGLLDYGDPVAKHVPEFTGDGREKVTIRHCLTHAAGMAKAPSFTVADEAGWNAARAALCRYVPEWEPGSRSAYHGWSGAFLAAECVRRVRRGQEWAALCRESLFAPLGADSLTFAVPGDDEPVAIVPQPKADRPLPGSGRAAFTAAGQPGAGCSGTLREVLKVLQLHLQEGVWDARRLIAPEAFRRMHTVQYVSEIEADRAAGKPVRHEPWGLGPLLRGEGAACPGHGWFGFRDQRSPGIFGHAGIDTVIGVADPETRLALAFVTTHSPQPSDQTVPLRNRVTNRVFLDLAAGGGGAAETGSRELIQDPRFRRGFRACRPPPGRHDRYGELAGFEPGQPAWDLLQWSSRESLALAPAPDTDVSRVWSNACKTVALGRGAAAAGDLELAVNGWEEYGTRARRDGEPWVHLLIEQFFPEPPALDELKSARFRIAARLLRSRLRKTDDYSTGRHAAQFQVFLTVQNRNRESAGFGRLLWFGIPLYDDRHRVPLEHKTQDTAGSEMFIFTPPGSAYTSASAHDGDWVRVDCELLPLLRESVETAWSKGFLTESRRLSDYQVTGLNLGWEVPGIFDVSVAVKELGLSVVEERGRRPR